jgi:hypothetical protein
VYLIFLFLSFSIIEWCFWNKWHASYVNNENVRRNKRLINNDTVILSKIGKHFSSYMYLSKKGSRLQFIWWKKKEVNIRLERLVKVEGMKEWWCQLFNSARSEVKMSTYAMGKQKSCNLPRSMIPVFFCWN